MYPGNAKDDRVECQSRLRGCECAGLPAELYMGLATDPGEYRAPLRGGDVHISNVLVDRGYVLVFCNT